MSVFTEAETFHAQVFKLDVSTPVKGGNVAGALTAPSDGEANAPLQALADRTAWLKLQHTMLIGEVKMFAAAAAPNADYQICNGASLSQTTYADLFAVIGTAFGTAGAGFFNLPDLQGQFVRGWDNAAGADPNAGARTASGTGGATGDNVGSAQDEAFKSHTHAVPSSAGAGSYDVIATPLTSQAPNVLTVQTAADGGSETRPVNINMNYIIRVKVTV